MRTPILGAVIFLAGCQTMQIDPSVPPANLANNQLCYNVTYTTDPDYRAILNKEAKQRELDCIELMRLMTEQEQARRARAAEASRHFSNAAILTAPQPMRTPTQTYCNQTLTGYNCTTY